MVNYRCCLRFSCVLWVTVCLTSAQKHVLLTDIDKIQHDLIAGRWLWKPISCALLHTTDITIKTTMVNKVRVGTAPVQQVAQYCTVMPNIPVRLTRTFFVIIVDCSGEMMYIRRFKAEYEIRFSRTFLRKWKIYIIHLYDFVFIDLTRLSKSKLNRKPEKIGRWR